MFMKFEVTYPPNYKNSGWIGLLWRINVLNQIVNVQSLRQEGLKTIDSTDYKSVVFK
jgi:hypothetical protein